MQWLLPCLAAGTVLGVVLSEAFDVGSVDAWPLLLCGLSVCALATSAWVKTAPWRVLGVVGLVLGFATHLGAPEPDRGLPSGWGRDHGTSVELEGVVIDSARPRRKGGWTAVVEVHRCEGSPCSGRLLLSAKEGQRPRLSGDRLVVLGRVWWPRRAEAAYLPDTWRWMARRGLAAGVVALEVDLLGAEGGGRAAIDRWRLSREAWMRRELGDRGACLVMAILTGSKGLVDPATRDPIDKAGLSHLLAISGLHLMFVAWLFFVAFEALLGRSSKARAWAPLVSSVAGLLAVALFATIVGWPVSARRAFIMLCCWRLALSLGRDGALGTGLAAAVIVIVLGGTTHAVFDPGLHLSVTALVGMGVFAGGEDQAKGILHKATSSLKTSVACSIACAPWLLWHFGRLPLLGVALNVLAIPLAAIALMSGLLAIAMSHVWLSLARFFLECSAGALSLVGSMATWLPLSGMSLGAAAGFGTALVFVLAAALAAADRGRIALVAVAVGCALSGTQDPSAHIRFFPVGQGDAVLLTDGRGHSIFVDCPGAFRGGTDPGDRVVRPGLARIGISKIDVVVVSHGDADHVGGLASVVRTFRPKEVWWSDPGDETPDQLALLDAVSEVGAKLKPPPRAGWVGDIFIRRLDIEVSPSLEHGLSRNERSTVLEAEVDGMRLLLTGDIETLGEWRALPETRPVHVLKVAHHGSRTSSSEAFIERAKPMVAVVQSGLHNRFGHPHDEVVERLDRVTDGRVYNTADCGEIVIRRVGAAMLLEAALVCGREAR